MKQFIKQVKVPISIILVVLGVLLSTGILPDMTVSAEGELSYEGGNISTEKSSGKTIITVTSDDGYELKAGSLVVTDKYGDTYIPTRVGFRETESSTQYSVKTSTDIWKIDAEFIQPTTANPNIGYVNATVDTDTYGLRLVSRIGRTVKDGVDYVCLDGQDAPIKDYGMILALKDIVGETELTMDLANANTKIQKISAIESNNCYDSCDSYVDISTIITNTDSITGATKEDVLSRAYVELEDGTILYGSVFDTTYREAANILEPENVVLTTGNAYPVWDGNGGRTVEVPVTDMNGDTKTLVLNNEEEVTVIPGKVYVAKHRSDETSALLKAENLVLRGMMSSNENDILTITRAGTDYQLKLSSDVYKYQVSSNGSSGHFRLKLDTEGIGPTSKSYYNTLYTIDELGDINCILTTNDGGTAYNSLWNSHDNASGADTPDVAKSTFETVPVVFVTATPYLKDGNYVVDYKDVFGETYTAVPFNYKSTDFPKLNLPYKVTMTDGVATLDKLTSGTGGMTRSETLQSYKKGVLTRTDKVRTYTITADTCIIYVQKNGSTLNLVDKTNGYAKINGGITTDSTFNTVMSNVNFAEPATKDDYIQWMMVEVSTTPQSIYNLTQIFDDTSKNWYNVSNRPTLWANEIMLMTSDLVWDDTQEKYLIDAVDMNGQTHTLEYTYVAEDEQNSSGVIPVKGKIFVVTAENDITKFSWAGSVQPGGSANANNYYDILRAGITNYDSETKQITLYSSSGNGKTYTLADDAIILGSKQYASGTGLNNSSFIEYVDEKTSISTVSSDTINALFGLNKEGKVIWILNTNDSKSMYHTTNNTNYTAPVLEELKNQ